MAHSVLAETCAVPDKRPLGNDYAFLDQTEIRARLCQELPNQQVQVVLSIPSVHCTTCVWLLEELPQHVPGVLRSGVNFLKKELTVQFDPASITLRQLVERLVRLGYPPVFSHDSDGKKHVDRESRTLWLRLGLAGFGFGNIMLFSLPEYLSLTALDPFYRVLFSWINLILAIPVLAYSSFPYLQSGYQALKYRRINIDVPISLGILTLFLRSAWDIITFTGPGYMDSFAGFIFLLLIGRMLQHKTHRSLAFDRDYKAYFPIAVLLKQGRDWVSTSIERLQEGDIIRLRNGEIVPADAELSSLNGLFDYSFITGEADSIQKYQTQTVLAGGRVSGKSVELTLTKKVDQSFLTRIWNEASGRSQRSERFDQTNLFSAIFTYAILLIAAATTIYWWMVDASMIWVTVSSVLIIACPCAIAIAPSFSFGTTSTLLARQGFYIRKPTVLPELAHISDIVFDKTGTLTSQKQVEVSWTGQDLNTEQKTVIIEMLNQSTHPLSRAIVLRVNAGNGPNLVSNFQEFPGQGLSATVNKTEYKLGSRDFVGIGKMDEEDGLNGHESRVYVVIQNTYWGYFKVRQPVKKELSMLLKSLKPKYKLRLLSGDSERFRDTFSPLFGDNMLFGQGVDDKVGFVENLRRKGAKVLMVGDGLNDAGALRVANVGMAVSDSTSSFSPGSDIIVASDHLDRLDQLMKSAGFSNQIVSASYLFSLLYNGIGLWLAVQGWLTPLACAILMPISSISVILFTTLSVYFHHLLMNRER